ncbi:diacylglycerol kinase family protein [Komagataeibacter sp. FNDCR2]|uniref:diacylglycerol/lipid kinase family protein n=1 Tax=Komagataeibacter sp. FNDCR2 TaxID=2878682 RepID=UPI0021038A58|nr:diacylglycerol kinase family protein [Komagataeibacter sp. FNDCR2]MCE2576060.1 diacylglycerol kinase [Komagataeibacter sp. FNDCR2]
MIFIIVNPCAGGHRSGRVARFAHHLRQAGLDVEIGHTRFRGHATVLARAAAQTPGCTHIVAAGGDGTIAEVAEGMAGSDCVLAILPLGTANVLARELALPFDDALTARIIAAGGSRTIWPGRLQSSAWDGLFVQMVGVGFDAHVVHGVSTRLKNAVGRMAYVVSMLGALRQYRFPTMTVMVDGVAHEAVSAIISKGARYGGKYVLAPHSMQGEQRFCVVLFHVAGIGAVLRAGFALLRGTLARQKGVTILTGRRVEIPARPALPVQGDGDARGFTPLRIDISDRPLRVAVALTGGEG